MTVVTDSTACLPRDLVKRYGIVIIPVELSYGGKVYRDGVDITPTEVYQFLERNGSIPTTSAPSPGACFDVLKSLSEETRAILAITVSTQFSHVHESVLEAAEMARQQLPGLTVTVLDSGTAAGAHGLVVLGAAKVAAEGKSLEQVVEAARRLMSGVYLVAFLDTLAYLAKGGRVPQAVAWATSLLRIKPVMQIRPAEGQPSLVKKVRTRTAAVEQLLVEAKARADSRPLHAVVMHSNASGEAEALRQKLLAAFDCAETYVSDFTPVMGVHTGPGLLGLAFYADGH